MDFKRRSNKLLTVFELQKRSGKSVAYWRKAILQRKIPFVKLGRSVRVPEEVFLQLIEDGWRDPVPTNTN